MRLSLLLFILATYTVCIANCEGNQRNKLSVKPKQIKVREDEIDVKRKQNIIKENYSKRKLYPSKSKQTVQNQNIKPIGPKNKGVKSSQNQEGNNFSGKTKQSKLRGIEIDKKIKPENIRENYGRRKVSLSESNKPEQNQKKNQEKNPIREEKPDREPFKNPDKGNYNTNRKKKVHLNDFSSNDLENVKFNRERRPQELFKNAFAQPINEESAETCSEYPPEIFVSARKSYTIQSPGYPLVYQKNQDCGWFFTAGEGVKELKLTCETFKIRKPNKKGKCKDYMLLSDGFDITGHCEQDNPTGLSTLTGYLDAWFVSSKKKNNRFPGFACKIEGIPTKTSFIQPGEPDPPVIDYSCRCGRINKPTKVVGGEESSVNEYPWIVAIVKKDMSEVFCGAAIINSRWIITAAHCTDYITYSKVEYQVLVGAHSTVDSADAEIRLNPIRIAEHPDYDYANVINDISLIEIPPLSFSSNLIAPICLPDPESLYEATDAIVTGWGALSFGGSQPDVLMEVTVPTITNSRCEKSYPGEILDTMICAMGDGGKDACQGDSGGPLIASDGNHHVLIGIVSWGRGCAMAGYPGVYTRVTKYLNWINTEVNAIKGDLTVCATE